ncbi:WRC domain-containing protein/QLQ domain-containing protein [Cephalotus follicularis]|uniref:Growth-regulating factor n=1 Tax=Cephalotus follicularis TaxID=3775 RepID=A0A1Q3BGC0_CEPFO|nr:WRC domain-containing protein/QLQ domain-containing protein [Cephalotus follicularis]
MDLHLKEWRNQQLHESERHPSAKIPKLLLDDPQYQPPQQHQQQHSGSSAPNSKISNLSDSTTRRMGSYFSLAQWQELQLQALIYRYMLAGAAVPSELLQPIKKSILHSPPYFLHHPLQHYPQFQPALLQSGYWGRAAMDPEPGRCRRTDGKKWRCSRDVVAGQKYCERHVHRGRNRSRKPVENPTPTTTSNLVAGAGAVACGTLKTTSPTGAPPLAIGPTFGLSGQSYSVDLLNLNQSSKNENKGTIFGSQNEVDGRADGRILRHFFDDWPRSLQEPENAGNNATSSMNSVTCLSMSSSDVSLKLSTGNVDEAGHRDNSAQREQQPLVNWSGGWATTQVASMGGPLAEALRSSTTNSSPKSVLNQLPPRGSASETSYVST